MYRIMVLSVIKRTESKVKFWFLKNYLSPSFKVKLLRICYLEGITILFIESSVSSSGFYAGIHALLC